MNPDAAVSSRYEHNVHNVIYADGKDGRVVCQGSHQVSAAAAGPAGMAGFAGSKPPATV
jgi:hypothetical protein